MLALSSGGAPPPASPGSAATSKRRRAEDPIAARVPAFARRREPSLVEACRKPSACSDFHRNSAAARRAIEVMLEEEPHNRRVRESSGCDAATTSASALGPRLLDSRAHGASILFEVHASYHAPPPPTFLLLLFVESRACKKGCPLTPPATTIGTARAPWIISRGAGLR